MRAFFVFSEFYSPAVKAYFWRSEAMGYFFNNGKNFKDKRHVKDRFLCGKNAIDVNGGAIQIDKMGHRVGEGRVLRAWGGYKAFAAV